jgi:hypothetical protein
MSDEELRKQGASNKTKRNNFFIPRFETIG